MTTCRHILILNDYPTHVKISEHQRPKYWEEKDRAKIGVKLAERMHKGEVAYVMNKGKKCLFDIRTNDFILRNASQAGEPRFVSINGNILYASGKAIPFTRQKIRDFLHSYFKEHILMQLPAVIEIPAGKFMQTEFVFYDALSVKNPKGHHMDWFNRSYFYLKTFEDLCQEMNLIKNDNPAYIRGGYARYVDLLGEGIEESSQRKLIIKIHFLSNTEHIEQ